MAAAALLACSLLVLCTLSVVNSQQTAPVLFVFGDSLSDTGNTFGLTNGTVPPKQAGYWNGHFAEGATWPDFLVNLTRLEIANYALGGSTGCPVPINATSNATSNVTFPALEHQISQALSDLLTSNVSTNASNRAALIWTGHDDFYDALISLQGDNLTTALQALVNITDCIQAAADTLLTNGTFSQIVLTNVLPMQLIPLVNAMAAAQGTIPGLLLKTTIRKSMTQINDRITEVIVNLKKKYPSANIRLWNINDNLQEFIRKALQPPLNFKNATEACLPLVDPFNASAVIPPACSDPSSFVFWDPLHPSSRTHKFMADGVFSVIKNMQFLKGGRRLLQRKAGRRLNALHRHFEMLHGGR
mmetsp:Transcript_12109/g.26019  ORF Transcript_12109/g.26019 Transcript_12109/m.26019 type:complete len:359 (-) Transcript_12109:655-1731(-)|eukprot:CAMPEP_0202902166 /NCGR_PEP_ID=MMETSP1392-20130828/16702_1 /ASSEMBLY_ACC=CAM_ASM_000868 /TAXON_ID=225041 /ORGANISM="Chlamydomonas chlamydogama, Strain SAG 11-48b" /LENGTH=358 /DNA_ID=CAMNT_0049588895 /DNA_START=55 /DNA_END=1131 /DNA_ORIENTATION=+